jgi:hypothetical protein
MSRSVVAVRHVLFEDLGILAPLLTERGYCIRYLEPQVLGGVQRFRTVSSQPFLNRGTVRRGGLGAGSILRFASELQNMLLHIFRLEAKASLSGRRKKDRSGKSRKERDGLRI